VSLIGTLEQLNLSNVLQRIEAYAKTGLLVIKQGVQWVELYFRDGRLMCLGPIRPNITLGDRLLQAGVISPQALQEALLALGAAPPSETRMALTLMDLGHVSHEGLRAWATKQASEVIQVLLTWPTGEIYFEDGQQPTTDRLLIALSITSLLPPPSGIPAPQAVDGASSAAGQERPRTTVPLCADPPTLFSASQFLPETPSEALSFSSSEIFANPGLAAPPRLSQPMRVTAPLPLQRIDTSFLRPEMVLIPADFSALREQNPHIPLTSEQWQIFRRADGRTPLQKVCEELGVLPEQVCQVAGELIAQCLVHPSMPLSGPVNELTPTSAELIGSGNDYVAPGSVAPTVQFWETSMPTTDPLRPFSPSAPIETQSQWGNGANGATFIPRRGWVVAAPQPLEPLQPSGPLYVTNSTYAVAGDVR